MSNVTLHIGGRSFTVACADGEEAHIAGLGQVIDDKLSSMGDMAGQSETRMLLFAALLMADELHEAQSAPRAHDAEARDVGAHEAGVFASDLAGRLGAMADRLENLAARLEG